MPRFTRANWDSFSNRERRVLRAVAKDGLTINAQGDFEVGRTVVRNGETMLVGGLIALVVREGGNPIGVEQREILLKESVRWLRGLGVDRE